ncbi:hypothetical protein K8R66_04685 [bacterium]|nr:hypothetical protein [bacterium]
MVNTITNKSIFTVYIKANSTYSINKISNGNHKLFFNLGNDWNAEIKAFMVNSSYEVFEDNFNFLTKETEEYEEYKIFNVTLNPVIGGHAETEDISVLEFANY